MKKKVKIKTRNDGKRVCSEVPEACGLVPPKHPGETTALFFSTRTHTLAHTQHVHALLNKHINIQSRERGCFKGGRGGVRAWVGGGASPEVPHNQGTRPTVITDHRIGNALITSRVNHLYIAL